ncbi:helix-turn-helix protein [Cricetibacter osteomyelitidis]|uniref:Helix-turn-helix protein n=1 Tax=Cricetibacter osteomyelitidis TaxID=1521931 RepID=A0A4R2T2M3_9PAST|nr:helix-turn-helix transcriptional regulator [Cricetibacter osteomyelitidis]TCP91228.1 helix-turn-helix protein [Cricetibacter osteomyelitidis]
MKLNQKVRTIREINQWTQEEMAEKLNMSVNGYAKIERGESKLSLEKLEQIAHLFNMDALEFMNATQKGVYFLLNDSVDNNVVYYGQSDEKLLMEIEKLKLMLQHKDELLEQKQLEINRLDRIIQSLER